VGKTTVARALLAHHSGPAAYFHFLPPLRGPLSRSPGPASAPPPKAAPGGWLVLGWIGDRWMYGYVVQPDALRFHGPDALARAVLRLLPRPHLIVNLAAPPHVIRQRKQELTLSQIEQELLAWSSLRVANVQTLDATRLPNDIASDILMALASSRSAR
jgi:hypothetical protein